VLAGGTYFSPAVEKRLMRGFARGHAGPGWDPIDALTDRELEVFRLIGRGRTTREIAAQLSLSTKTVESHRMQITSKLSVKTVAALMRCAFQMEQEEELRTSHGN